MVTDPVVLCGLCLGTSVCISVLCMKRAIARRIWLASAVSLVAGIVTSLASSNHQKVKLALFVTASTLLIGVLVSGLTRALGGSGRSDSVPGEGQE